MSDLKDKVAGYLSTFIDLEEWKPTRDDPYGERLVKAATAKDTETASAWPRPKAAKAELKAKAAEPLKGTIGLDTPLAVERPKATEPTLSRGAHTTPPEVKSTEKPHGSEPVSDKPVTFKAGAATDIAYLKHGKSGPRAFPSADAPASAGGQETKNYHAPVLRKPEVGPAPAALQPELKAAVGSHLQAQVAKGAAAGKVQAASKAAAADTRAADIKTHATPAQPANAARTKKQQYHDRRKAWKAGVRLGVNDPSTPAPHHTGTNPQTKNLGKVGTDVRRVDTAVSTALIAASKGNPEKQRLLRLQTRAPNNTPYDTANALPTPEPAAAPEAPKATGKGSFVSQEVLADLRKKAAEKK